MITKMADTCSTFSSAVSPQNRREGSPSSPTQESLKMKRSKKRYVPYQNSCSPKGSCSSSDNEANDIDSTADYCNEMGSGVESKSKRLQANSRERKRMHTVNSAFDQLRELVPTYPSNRKLSKIDTLRLACTYIQDLVSVLQQTRLMQGLPADDLTQFQVYGAEFSGMPGPYSPCFNGVKSEPDQFAVPAAFTNYRPMTSTCITPTCDSDYSTSEPELSPPSPYLQGTLRPPPPLARTSSDSSAQIIRPLSHTTVSSAPRQLPYPSPLATHAVQHPNGTLINEQGLTHSPPIWQRAASYPVFGQ